jgi:hypothetical protein
MVPDEASAQTIEDFHGEPLWIRWRLEHDRRHCSDKHDFGDPLRSMTRDVSRDFAASGRVPHQRHVPEIERFDQRRQIVGIAIHVIARGSLA